MIRNKAKELGADLVSFLNLKDYDSPRSPNPFATSPRPSPFLSSLSVLSQVPIDMGKIPGARCHLFYMRWNRLAIQPPII